MILQGHAGFFICTASTNTEIPEKKDTYAERERERERETQKERERERERATADGRKQESWVVNRFPQGSDPSTCMILHDRIASSGSKHQRRNSFAVHVLHLGTWTVRVPHVSC